MIVIEQLFRPVAPHPFFQDLQVFGFLHVRHRHLVGAPGALHGFPVHEFRPRPALRSAHDNHGPDWQAGRFLAAGLVLDRADFLDRSVERRSHGLAAVAGEKLIELFFAESAQHGGIGNLVAVEMQNGQHGSMIRVWVDYALSTHFLSSCCLAAPTTCSGSNPNFLCNSLSGAEAPKVFMPTT